MTTQNKKLEELFAENFSDEERREIERRAKAMLLEMRLAELRQALQLTQEEVAEALGRNQSAVAALEKRTDMLLSTLRRYVEAMGGELEVIVRIPKSPPVRIALRE
ncbi:MAG TPA: XRE family transcriptional regulator [Thermoanaerobaculia bacterium]|jgi:DNA-binding XRE family transcriptional regulator